MQKNFIPIDAAKVVPIGGVTEIDFDGAKMSLNGYAFFEDLLEKNNHKIQHTLIVEGTSNSAVNDSETGEIKQYFEIGTVNIGRAKLIPDLPGSVNYVDEKIYSDNYSYKAEVDLATLYDGNPLPEGQYTLKVRLRQFIDGRWQGFELPVGPIIGMESDMAYTAKMRKFAAKRVTTYSLTAKQKRESREIELNSFELSTLNPADLIVRDEVVESEHKSITLAKRAAFRVAYTLNKLLPIKKNRVSFFCQTRESI